jgi:hypothetical protein
MDLEFYQKHDIFNILWKNQNLSLSHIHTVLEYLKAHNKLDKFIPELYFLIEKHKITAPMLKMIFDFIPNLDVFANRFPGASCNYIRHTLFGEILGYGTHPYAATKQKLNELLLEIKYNGIIHDFVHRFDIDHYILKSKFEQIIENYYRIIPEENPIITIIEICPQMFLLIDHNYLTLPMCNAYYLTKHWSSSKTIWTKSVPDKFRSPIWTESKIIESKSRTELLFELIPKKFHEHFRERLNEIKTGSKTKAALRTALDLDSD